MQTVKDTKALWLVLLLTNLLSYHNGSANTLIRAHTVHKIWRVAELNEQPLPIKTIWLPGFPKYWRWLSFPYAQERKHFRTLLEGPFFNKNMKITTS